MKPVRVNKPVSQLSPLEVKCSQTRCQEGFHYYTSKRAPKGGSIGDCRVCGDASVDWDRIHKHDIEDLDYTFSSLKRELLRHVCWVNELDPKVIPHAIERGKPEVLRRATEIVTKRIAKIPVGHFDYMCTPKHGREIIHYAQHGTATCCRKCLERWHNIPQDIVLNSNQIKYIVGLIEKFIDDRVPELKPTIHARTRKAA